LGGFRGGGEEEEGHGGWQDARGARDGASGCLHEGWVSSKLVRCIDLCRASTARQSAALLNAQSVHLDVLEVSQSQHAC
jgi:hypothetical protein